VNARAYALVTGAYWAFTLTDGALRMLVLLYFHDLGYNPVSLAMLFLLYELFGIFTNLIGGWIGARYGLHRTLTAGLAVQIAALLLLSVHEPGWREWLAVAWVMGAQALSGIAKDLTKMSSKTAVKFVAAEGRLFRLVALLTGSKNALKGLGFFLGAALLSAFGFDGALQAMAIALAVVFLIVIALLGDLGRSSAKPAISNLLQKSPAITRLSAARFFLFASRDIWFVVALPVYLSEQLDWSFEGIGAFLALWVIGYGAVQSAAPKFMRRFEGTAEGAFAYLFPMALICALITYAVMIDHLQALATVGGLLAFGVMFALTSSAHSYLILAYSTGEDDTALDVGYYYSANAAGRLVGTLLSGVLFLIAGFAGALVGAGVFLLASLSVAASLPPIPQTAGATHVAVS